MMKRHRLDATLDTRRGSTLLIVLSLLGLLTLLGLIFFTFANQERLSAEYFSAAAKEDPTEPDDGFDFGLKQLLIGPSEYQENSVLYGRPSIVTNLMGTDSRPYSGSGVNIIYWDDPNTAAFERIPAVDQNRDGQPDVLLPDGRSSVQQLLNLVDAPTAHDGLIRDVRQMASPDTGVTYPDQNSVFLSYKGVAYREVGGSVELVPIIIPSFMRPALFRAGDEDSVTATNWLNDFGADNDPGTPDDPYAARSFRPHRLHKTVVLRDNQLVAVDRRYLDANRTDSADDAIIAALPGGSGGFPFTPTAEVTGFDVHDTKDGEMGIWTATPADLAADNFNNGTGAPGADGVPDFNPLVYELDVDTDDDGIRDAIWMDLDHPIIEDPATGAKYTLMYAFSVKDMEALINLNVHGNLSGDITDWSVFVGGEDFDLGGRTGSLSRSNYGLTPSEVNPVYALMRDPTYAGTGDFTQHERFFGRVPQNALEAANMEWFWLLMGRTELDTPIANGAISSLVPTSAISDLFVGRFGEPDRLYRQLTSTASLADFFFTRSGGTAFSSPMPGVALIDDNNDVSEGVGSLGLRGLTHPLSFDGAGRWVQAGNPRLPITRIVQNGGTDTALIAQQYREYSVFSPTGDPTDLLLGPNQFHYRGEDGVLGTADDLILTDTTSLPPELRTQPRTNTLFDDMNEGVAELEKTDRPADEMYGLAEAITMHLSNADKALAGDQAGDRFLNLAPWATGRRDIRERFTSSSNSLREHSFAIPFPPGVVTPFGRDGAPGWRGVDEDRDGHEDFINGDPSRPDMDEVGLFISPAENDINGNPGIHTYSEDGFRAWMFNADSALFNSDNNTAGEFIPNGRFEFPPRFGNSSRAGASETPSRGFVGTGNAYVGNALPFESREDLRTPGITNEDPFRPQVRRLLRMEAGDRRGTFGQLPLSINRFLDVERLPDQPADLIRGTLEYRALTAHLDSTNSDGTTSTTTLRNTSVTKGPFPPRTDLNGNGTLVDEIEYWARRDRQKMARDIYVLLYTLGGGNDAVNYTASNLSVTPGATSTDPPTAAEYNFYTDDQLRQMAQFAVNLVDALDRDNVSTRFEYDKNLGDTIDLASGDVLRTGWNLDDDIGVGVANGDPVFSTNDGFVAYAPDSSLPDVKDGGYNANFPEDSAERGVVYGVEKQELAFSEVLAFFQRELTSDHAATLYEDDDEAHATVHIELQNMTTQDVPLSTPESTNENEAIFRIRAFNDELDPSTGLQNWSTRQNRNRRITFLEDAPSVNPGAQFTIATSAGNDSDLGGHRPSDLFIDVDEDGTFDRISPSNDLTGLPAQTTPPATILPRADIDLVHQRDRIGSTMFSVNGLIPGTEGAFLTDSDAGMGPAVVDPMTDASLGPNGTPHAQVLVLERRANPHMPHLPLTENPWVEVDRTYMVFKPFALDDADTATELPGRVADIQSTYRVEPLSALAPNELPTDLGAAAIPRNNTIGSLNPDGTGALNAARVFKLIQPHYDRDFTSPGELLHLPLFGPATLTAELRNSLRVPSSTSVEDQVQRSVTPVTWAAAPTGVNPSGGGANRWIQPYTVDRHVAQGLVSGANAKFLMADFPDETAAPTYSLPPAPAPPRRAIVSADLDNRWYLLFGALEVPTRTHRQLGNPLLNLTRVPGKININTIRHPEVLQALLDDPLVADLDTANGLLGENPPGTPVSQLDPSPLPTQTTAFNGGTPLTEAARDWMQQLIGARDGSFQPPNGGHTLYIPGLPGSRPFTPFGQMAGNDYSLVQDPGNPKTRNFLNRGFAKMAAIDQNNTLLRSLVLPDFLDLAGASEDLNGNGTLDFGEDVNGNGMLDTNLPDGADDNNSARRLFEVSDGADFVGPGESNNALITPQTRHRLLSKILNNTTTSSNTFVVHVTIGLFEVYQDPVTGAVRIGGEYDKDQDSSTPIENNRKRGVFLIDRSEVFDAFDSGSGQFDYRRLIKHSSILQ